MRTILIICVIHVRQSIYWKIPQLPLFLKCFKWIVVYGLNFGIRECVFVQFLKYNLFEMWLFRFSSLTFIFRRFDTKMEIEKYDFLKYMTEDERSYILKISSFWKFVVGCVSIFLLVIGSLMKLVIYSFFSKKERHLDRPINSLILLDQVNIIKMKYKKGN